jgi:alkylhydroperoxidase family enzyme
MKSDVADKVLEDYRTAPIDEKLRATLRLLEKMTLEPEKLGPDDVRPVLALGVSREAVQDAMHVAYLFKIYDRLADSMGWHVPEKATGYYQAAAAMLLKRGYG